MSAIIEQDMEQELTALEEENDGLREDLAEAREKIAGLRSDLAEAERDVEQLASEARDAERDGRQGVAEDIERMIHRIKTLGLDTDKTALDVLEELLAEVGR